MNAVQRLSLKGKVAIVTGGGGGIGRACALAMAELGADLVIADIVPERCDEVAARISELGCTALAFPTDVMNTDRIRECIAASDDKFGRIDILVNNAGGVAYKPFLEQSERSWRRHIDINFVSMLAATHAAAPIMARGGRGGSIINVASIEGMRAGPNVAVYAACKAAMISFTRSMALELSGDNIRVNCIAPDHTITPGGRGNRSGPVDESKWRVPTPEQDDRMRRVIPLLREGEAYECGDLAAFLSSDMASYITGAIIPIDGGTSAAMGWVRGSQGQWTQMEGQRADR
ncbi:SDR family oxidoreductase [Croceicoccus sp. BE223]|uniref:SDR family NAD(P)-dependent oxidoreductase n=1 Tax=Croceicoccus sp. BE223 TaxID=2817716 RepID=UPI0028592792|nr:SDR family oxidoreductase [Croceicoccus sp. BE223]MDR7103670.1 NAD(P)-dependent dehydrogenase (short-subunit alcohol dehydrogenase family) [Croceicoccus sp. BE223]